MKGFKGTPGPWKWTQDVINEGNALIGSNGEYVFYGDNICSGLSNDDGWGARIGGMHGDKESELNASLIAAAPELLEALIKLVDIVDDMTHGPSTDAAHAAINKALGE